MILQTVDVHGSTGTLESLTAKERNLFQVDEIYFYEYGDEIDGNPQYCIEDNQKSMWKFGEFYIIAWNCEGHAVMDTFRIVEE